jgi:hypothetical protein
MEESHRERLGQKRPHGQRALPALVGLWGREKLDAMESSLTKGLVLKGKRTSGALGR